MELPHDMSDLHNPPNPILAEKEQPSPPTLIGSFRFASAKFLLVKKNGVCVTA
jgi:hypothetical protein